MNRQALEPLITALEDGKGSGTGTEDSVRINQHPPSELRIPVAQEPERVGYQAGPNLGQEADVNLNEPLG
ncbi:hypothetical protein TNCT_169601 [Trichonephila clavata]|uniref:Uncharacterized protein n=1 Tax=Trichonephila clavata TaxID=2740835 RepID=A0A8X6KH22_TRICU|nr:hypothetical protein TNCT_169601 [Trichonephila clavata]